MILAINALTMIEATGDAPNKSVSPDVALEGTSGFRLEFHSCHGQTAPMVPAMPGADMPPWLRCSIACSLKPVSSIARSRLVWSAAVLLVVDYGITIIRLSTAVVLLPPTGVSRRGRSVVARRVGTVWIPIPVAISIPVAIRSVVAS